MEKPCTKDGVLRTGLLVFESSLRENAFEARYSARLKLVKVVDGTSTV